MLLIDYQLYLIIQSYRWQFCDENCWSLEALCADASASAVTTFESLRLRKKGNLTTSVRCIGLSKQETIKDPDIKLVD